SIEYNTDSFDATTITRLLKQFATLLVGVVADPARRLADLPLLTPAERQQQLVEWNDTRSGIRDQGSGVRNGRPVSELVDPGSSLPDRESPCIHQLFEAQAERTPDAIAVLFDHRPSTTDHRPPTKDERRTTKDEHSVFSIQRSAFSVQMTYGELNRRAD